MCNVSNDLQRERAYGVKNIPNPLTNRLIHRTFCLLHQSCLFVVATQMPSVAFFPNNDSSFLVSPDSLETRPIDVD